MALKNYIVLLIGKEERPGVIKYHSEYFEYNGEKQALEFSENIEDYARGCSISINDAKDLNTGKIYRCLCIDSLQPGQAIENINIPLTTKIDNVAPTQAHTIPRNFRCCVVTLDDSSPRFRNQIIEVCGRMANTRFTENSENQDEKNAAKLEITIAEMNEEEKNNESQEPATNN